MVLTRCVASVCAMASWCVEVMGCAVAQTLDKLDLDGSISDWQVSVIDSGRAVTLLPPQRPPSHNNTRSRRLHVYDAR